MGMRGGLRRFWSAPRQCYTPRAWPVVAISVALSAIASQLVLRLVSAPWTAVALIFVTSVVVGSGVVQVRWWYWRRRHPPVPVEVMARRAARWN